MMTNRCSFFLVNQPKGVVDILFRGSPSVTEGHTNVTLWRPVNIYPWKIFMETDRAECHECETSLPLTEEFFYRYKGKFWIYRCKDCAHKRNLQYYRENLAKQGKKMRPKRGPRAMMTTEPPRRRSRS